MLVIFRPLYNFVTRCFYYYYHQNYYYYYHHHLNYYYTVSLPKHTQFTVPTVSVSDLTNAVHLYIYGACLYVALNMASEKLCLRAQNTVCCKCAVLSGRYVTCRSVLTGSANCKITLELWFTNNFSC